MIIGYHTDFNPTTEAYVINPPFVNKTENRENEKFVCEGSSSYPTTPTIDYTLTMRLYLLLVCRKLMLFV